MSLPAADQDRDTVKPATVKSVSPLTSPFRENFNFDWFSFEGRGSEGVHSPRPNDASPVTPSSQPSPGSLGISTTVSPVSPRLSVVKLPSPPNKPLAWVWQCHQCRCRYPLAVTRRCLNDGHYYCSGESQSTTATATKNLKRRKKATSCTSEFDYIGWAQWGTYRRKCVALRAYANEGFKAEVKLKGCLGCSFPSQCRYESRPPVETIDLKQYVDRADVVDVQEMAKLIQVGVTSKSINRKKTLNTSANCDSDRPRNSLGHRFYSSLTGAFSSADLPSSSVAGTSTQTDQDMSVQIKPTSAASTAAFEYSLSPKMDKRRVKIAGQNDSTSHDQREQKMSRSASVSSHDLQRTESTQSLLTDFFHHTNPGSSISASTSNESEPTPPPLAFPAPTFQSTGRSSSRSKWNRPSFPLPPNLGLYGKDPEPASVVQEVSAAGFAGPTAVAKSRNDSTGSNSNSNSGTGIGYVLGGLGYGKK